MTTPAAPPAPTITHTLALRPKPHRPHRRAPAQRVELAPISRGSGGPAPLAEQLVTAPVAVYSPAAATSFASETSGPSRARLFFLVALACGFLLVVASALPGQTLRPALVQEVVVVHRLDLALVGFSIVLIVGTLYLLVG